jgi:uncharacterized protein (TIGR03083 family)
LVIDDIVTAVDARTNAIVDALGRLDETSLLAPSELPEWSRLTIACHLRFGAETLRRMTEATVAGEQASYYPHGRERERPTTFVPRPGGGGVDVVASLARTSAALCATWRALDASQWELVLREPEGAQDLGPLALERLPRLRLTEVEVHGTDLGVGLDDWSATFVHIALPFRLEWLNSRRTNHRAVDDTVEGSWLLRATDGPTYLVSVDSGHVESHPAAPGSTARAVIEASSRDLLALLLGRRARAPLTISGDEELARAFTRAFPGP